MRPSIKYLSEAEVVRVHEKALEMLENLGMKFEGAEARDYFAKAGGRGVRPDCKDTTEYY